MAKKITKATAFEFVKCVLAKDPQLVERIKWLGNIGNKKAERCSLLIKSIMNGEEVSDRNVLILARYVKRVNK